MADGARFTTTVARGECVVVASGELDMECAGELRAVLEPLTGSVVLDLSAVTFVDSTTLSVLVGAQNRLNASGGKLRIRDPHDVPRRVFEITGLSMWIED